MNTPTAAKYLGISQYYLRNMRHMLHNHEGPPCKQIDNVRGGIGWDYAKEDLDQWKKNHKFKKDKK